MCKISVKFVQRVNKFCTTSDKFFLSSEMSSPFNCWIFLWLTATLASASTTDYSKLKLPPAGSWYLENFGKLRPGEPDRYTGCMCPPSLNTSGSVYMFCGHEMSPKAGGTCQPVGAYRCVDGQTEAILEADCSIGATKRKCSRRPTCVLLKIDCDKHNAKSCIRV